MLIEYVLQYKWNRKWKDLPWTSKNKQAAIRERDLRIEHYRDEYRVVERTVVETVVN
jgi:hypothetical protein